MNAAPDRLLIREALTKLSAQDRALICRAYYDGWTTGHIAEELQITDRIVKSRLHYAVRALQRTIISAVPQESAFPS